MFIYATMYNKLLYQKITKTRPVEIHVKPCDTLFIIFLLLT